MEYVCRLGGNCEKLLVELGTTPLGGFDQFCQLLGPPWKGSNIDDEGPAALTKSGCWAGTALFTIAGRKMEGVEFEDCLARRGVRLMKCEVFKPSGY